MTVMITVDTRSPAYDRSRAVVTAVDLPVSAGRTPMRRLEDEFVPPLLETAPHISRDLGRPATA